MKKILFIVCALCATLVNAQTDMTAEQLKAAMAGKVYFNNNFDKPLGVIAKKQTNSFWGTNENGFGPVLSQCISITDEGNGKYATTYGGNSSVEGLAVTFTVENDVVTRFEVTSACTKVPVGIYTPFNPGTLSNSCAKDVFVYLNGTFIYFSRGTTTIAENLENFSSFFMSKASMESDDIYVPEGLTFSQYNVYGCEELTREERDNLMMQGKFFMMKLVECTEATFTPSKPSPALDPDAEYVVVTYKEGSDTKTAYYKATDVEKIEWLKGEDITE